MERIPCHIFYTPLWDARHSSHITKNCFFFVHSSALIDVSLFDVLDVTLLLTRQLIFFWFLFATHGFFVFFSKNLNGYVNRISYFIYLPFRNIDTVCAEFRDADKRTATFTFKF